MRDSRFKIPYPEMTVRRKVTSTHFVLFVKWGVLIGSLFPRG
jgi:hypothetical protein